MKMLFDTDGDRYEAIVRKHADRLPIDGHPILVSAGWYPLVDQLLDHVARDHPTAIFTRIQAGGGWLRVDIDNGSRPFDPHDDVRLSKTIQGYVTQSLSTCEECGRHHGGHVDATAYGCGTSMNRTLCEECVPVLAALATTTLARVKQQLTETCNMITPDIDRVQLSDLRKRYPRVFDTAVHVGVGIGWLSIIEDFLTSAVTAIETKRLTAEPDAPQPDFWISEIKEKFGGMRMAVGTEEILPTHVDLRKDQILAEERSQHRCEVCGQPGFIRRPPTGWTWWRCRCDEHCTPDQLSWLRHPSTEVQARRQTYRTW